MTHEEGANFVRQLTQATRSKKVTWSETADPDTFVASFKGKYAVTVGKAGVDDDGDQYYAVEMTDEKKRTMLQLTFFTEGADLFREARDAALNVDQAVQDILADFRETLS